MPKAKWKPKPDPASDLELELSRLATVSELLIEAIDIGNEEHVAYLAELIPMHAGKARQAFAAWHAERRTEQPAPESHQQPDTLSAEDRAALLRLLDRQRH